jgi:hypothetical protein
MVTAESQNRAPSRGSVPHVRQSVATVIRPSAASGAKSYPGFSQELGRARRLTRPFLESSQAARNRNESGMRSTAAQRNTAHKPGTAGSNQNRLRLISGSGFETLTAHFSRRARAVPEATSADPAGPGAAAGTTAHEPAGAARRTEASGWPGGRVPASATRTSVPSPSLSTA